MKIKKLTIKRAAMIILAINIIQIGLLVLLLVYSLITSESLLDTLGIGSQFFLMIITITSLINGFISTRSIYLLIQTDYESHLLQDTLSKVENLNNSLRAQRHDFLNHLQVVYGLMEMGEYHDAGDYIDKVYHNIQKVSRVLKTANPAINALLQAKLLDAEKKNIRLDIHVASRFENLPVPSWEFCTVLGNLLDNAIQALEEKADDRLIVLELQEDPGTLFVRVKNNGPMIPPAVKGIIFQPGFTTKKALGEGMGLAITKKTVVQYGGTIDVQSDESLTVFMVSIPRVVP